MKIKLEITSQTLTPKQKGAIVEKLEEIRAIVKPKSNLSERAERVYQELVETYNKVSEAPLRKGMSLDEYLFLIPKK